MCEAILMMALTLHFVTMTSITLGVAYASYVLRSYLQTNEGKIAQAVVIGALRRMVRALQQEPPIGKTVAPAEKPSQARKRIVPVPLLDSEDEADDANGVGCATTKDD